MNINMQTVSLYMQEREPVKQGESGKSDASANKKEGAANAGPNADIVKVQQAQKNKQLNPDKTSPEDVKPEDVKKDAEKKNTAFFAVDDSNNVVIKIVNAKGELIKQIPPEDYLKMVEKMEKNSGKLFHKEV